MGGVVGKDVRWPRSYGGHIPRLAGKAELAWADCACIAERIGQMADRSSETPLKERLAVGDLADGGGSVALRQDWVGKGMRTNQNVWLAHQSLQLVPTEAEVRGQPPRVHGRLRREIRRHRPQPLLWPSAQVPIDGLEGGSFLDDRAAWQIPQPSVTAEHDTVEPSDRLLKFQPPKAATAIGEVRGDEQRPRCIVPPQHRPSMLDVVTIAIVKGQCRKRPPGGSTWSRPVENGIEGNDVEALLPQFGQHHVQKLRRDFETSVRREFARPPGPDMMKHQNHAPALGEAAKPAIGADGS